MCVRVCACMCVRPLKPLKGLESWINTIAFVSLLADETVSSFETENMQSDNESQRDGEEESGRNNVCVCVSVWAVFHFCRCRHVRATSGFCILSRELTVQLTGQLCVPLPFILDSVCVCVFRWVRYNVHVRTFTFHFVSLSFFLPLCAALFLSSQQEVTV